MTWQQGQSGNPNGGKLTQELRRALYSYQVDDTGNYVLDEDGNRIKNLRAVARALVNKARKGEIAAIQECFNRIDGRVPNDITVRRPNDLPATTFEELAQGVAEALVKLRQGVDKVEQSAIEDKTD